MRERLVPACEERRVDLLRAGIAHIPDIAVEARSRARPLLDRERGIVAAQGRDRAALRVAESQRHRALIAFAKPIIDDCAIRRVLADIEMLADLGAVGFLDGGDGAADAESERERNILPC